MFAQKIDRRAAQSDTALTQASSRQFVPAKLSSIEEAAPPLTTTFDFSRVAIYPPDGPNSPSSGDGRIWASRKSVPGCGQQEASVSDATVVSRPAELPSVTHGAQELQAKLTVNEPGDQYEQEADCVADQVMRMPGPQPVKVTSANHHGGTKLQRTCACGGSGEECEDCKSKREGLLQRTATDTQGSIVAPSIIHEVLRSQGRPLDSASRAFFEPRFGRDFDKVRIHTDPVAAQSAKAVRALAYAQGDNIVFAEGQFQPRTRDGQRLLAHELTHVAQSQNGVGQNPKTIHRQPDEDHPDATSSEAPMTRAEEIALSRTSPGLIAGERAPLALSLYNFGIDVSEPKAEHQAVLAELGHFLARRATVRVQVRSIGFADSSGPADYNMRLSRRRAVAVKAILDPLITQRITVSAYGETNPAAPNDTVEGRNRNRRVDIRFATDRPPGPVPPRPTPVPPGGTPTPIPEPPVPVPPGPGGGGGGGGQDTSFCEDHPILCGIGLLPFFAPLICLAAPEICATIGCALLPELCIPPLPPPPQPPGQPPDDDDSHHPMVIFTPDVRAGNTPPGMNDRIGIRDAVSVSATVINPPPATSPIRIFVSDNDSGAGNATINGLREISITGTTVLSVIGTSMTTGSYIFSPYIQLGAWWSGQLVGSSNRFAVSSIAQDWWVVDAGSNVGPFGYVSMADMDWVSDSGAYGHLDECRYVERVGLISESGGMTGLGVGDVNDPDDVNTCDFHPAFDEHGTPFPYTRDTHTAGTSRLKQLFTIRDMRSNSDWVASRNSGFEIHRTYERDPLNPRCWHLLVRKFGSGVSVGGWTAGAGSGDYTHEFRDIDCDPPPHVEPPTPDTPRPTEPDTPTPRRDEPTEPQVAAPCCDRPEMARRVDQCIEDAKQAAIDCTLATLEPPYDPISNARKLAEYYLCLDQLKADLLECDRRAKRDTNCPDQNTPSDCQPTFIAESASTPTGDRGTRLTESSVESFIESVRKTPLKPGEDRETMA